MMAVSAARLLRDGMVCFVGIGLPSQAANLARRTNAPGLVLVYESGTIGAKPTRLPLSIGDGELADTADAVVSVPEIFAYWLQAGRIDVGFLGAAQIDRHANLNSTVIGPYDEPTVRLPGAGGAPEIATSAKEVFVMLRQSLRTFVSELDFRTTPGGSVSTVVTDLGVLEPRGEERELTLTSVHPGVDADQAREATGWDLRVADDLSVTPGADRGRADRAAGARRPRRLVTEVDPPYLYPDYRSTVARAPSRALLPLPEELHGLAAPVFGEDTVAPGDADLTSGHAGEPLGERIIVTGRVLDDDGRPVRTRCSRSGRPTRPAATSTRSTSIPLRSIRTSPAPAARLTDDEGRYRFVTVKPGAYPWKNHANAWRPAHIHFSVFGRAFTQRLVTQMYFPGDPLFAYDPIFNSVRDPKARELLVARFDLETTEPEWALGYQWDIILRSTPFEE